jgi:hypothetical protein
MGQVFDSNSAHFGWGFFPFLFWALLLPFMAPLSGLAALVEVVRLWKRFPSELWRPIVWAGIAAVYWLTFAGWIPLAPQPIKRETVKVPASEE